MRLIRRVRRALRILKVASPALGSLPELEIVQSVGSFIAADGVRSSGLEEACTLDLGCGHIPRNPFNAERVLGIDLVENASTGVQRADLAIEPIPYPDQTFDYVTAFDFLEHVPRVIYAPERRFPFVELMNEIWRTLKQNGLFLSCTPVFPFSPAFRDPTHVNIISNETFPLYFDNTYRWAKVYGFVGSFEIIRQGITGPHLLSLLRKAGCERVTVAT